MSSIFDAASARFAPRAVEHLRKQQLIRFEFWLAFNCPEEAFASARFAAKGDARFTFARAPLSESDATLARREHVVLAEGGAMHLSILPNEPAWLQRVQGKRKRASPSVQRRGLDRRVLT